MKRGLGYIQDEPDERDYDISTLVSASKRTPASVDLTPIVPPVRDQGTTSSCVGQALAMAIATRAKFETIYLDLPSPMHIYACARRDYANPLKDEGCRPRDAMEGLRHYGVCSEKRWPFDPKKINSYPPFDTFHAGADARVTGYYRISAVGAARCSQIRTALSKGHPVVFAQPVDAPFDGYTAGVIGEVDPATNRGGHYTCLVGYGPSWFIGVNSWGLAWGNAGFYRVSDERIGSTYCTDFYCVSAVPTRLA